MYEIYIFFPSHYTFHRKIPDSKLNCISKNLSFPYFPLWFITALDRRTSHPFSFQFKTIPNRVSHEFLQNGARLGSKWRAVLDFSMVKHGYINMLVLTVLSFSSDIAFSVFHDSYASLTCQSSGGAKKGGNRGTGPYLRGGSWLLENRGNCRGGRQRPAAISLLDIRRRWSYSNVSLDASIRFSTV